MKKLYVFIIMVVMLSTILVSCSVNKTDTITETTTITTTETTTVSTTISTTEYIVASAPYEGMLKSNINRTELGAPTEVEKCRDFYKLQARARYKKYTWKKNGTTVFMATVRYCDHKNKTATSGYVSDITDWRSSATSTYRYTTKKHKPTTDPYNAKDYSNEEDFYDDHYDDFFDYYDAEDYYNKHH